MFPNAVRLRRHAPSWRIVAASVGCFTIASFGAETAFRIWEQISSQAKRYSSASFAMESLHIYSETYGWAPRPGALAVDEGQRISINSLGYRGESVGSSSRGQRRVLLLGDSISFGFRTSDEATFAHFLHVWDNGLEVVNLSVMGYGTDQELIKLKKEGERFHPDVVVLNFCVDNDFADNASGRSLYNLSQPKPYFKLEPGNVLREHSEHLRLGPAAEASLGLARYSHLWANLLTWRIPEAPSTREARFPWSQRKAAAMSNEALALQLSAELLSRARQWAASHDAAFLVVIHPNPESFETGSRLVDALVRAKGLLETPFLDMAKEYRSRNLRYDDVCLDHIGHLTSLGHQVAAEAIQGFILAHNSRLVSSS